MQKSPTKIPSRNRLTKQRQVILDVLRADVSHPNAESIYTQVKGILPRTSLATVYRNLKFLVDHSMIREIVIPGGANRYDGIMKDHDHFICNICQKIYNVPKYPLIKDYLPNPNYRVGGFKLDLFGVCAHCNDKEPCLEFFKKQETEKTKVSL